MSCFFSVSPFLSGTLICTLFSDNILRISKVVTLPYSTPSVFCAFAQMFPLPPLSLPTHPGLDPCVKTDFTSRRVTPIDCHASCQRFLC